MDGEPQCLPTRSLEERQAAHWALHRILVRADVARRQATVDALFRWSGFSQTVSPANRIMTGPQLLSAAGVFDIDIGAHGVHHLALEFQSPKVQRDEIDQGRTAVERLLDRPVRAFAYPYGSFSDGTVSIVRDVGFEVAVTCESSSVAPGADHLHIPRYEVKGWRVPEFAERLRRAFA